MIRSITTAILLLILATGHALAQSSIAYSDIPIASPSDSACVIGQTPGVNDWRRFCFSGISDYGRSEIAAATDAMGLPVGTTAQRPVSPAAGMIRYNGTLGVYEVYKGSAWVDISTEDDVFRPADATCGADVSAAFQSFLDTHDTVILRGGDCLKLDTQVTYDATATGVNKVLRTDGKGVVTFRCAAGERCLVFDNTPNVSASVAVTGIATVTDNTDDTVSEISFATLPTGAARQAYGVIYSNNMSTGDEGYYVTAITKANPAHVTLQGTVRSSSGIVNGASIRIEYAAGMTEINSGGATNCTVANIATVSGNTQFDCSNINSTSYGTYTGGAYAAREFGYWGEGFQVMEADASPAKIRTYGRLEFASKYTTTPKVRILDATNRLEITGPFLFTAQGNTYDAGTTDREEALVVKGYVNPKLRDLRFDRPYAQALWLQANAAGDYDDIHVSGGPDLTTSGAYTYGAYLYGPEFASRIGSLRVEQMRHGTTTGDDSNGGAFNDANWAGYGYGKDIVFDDIQCVNSNGACVEEHAASLRAKFMAVSCVNSSRGPESGTSSGICVNNRGLNPYYGQVTINGGSIGFRVAAIDHQFPNTVVAASLNGQGIGVDSGTDSIAGMGIYIEDQTLMHNKTLVRLPSVVMDDVGKGLVVDKAGRLTLGDYMASRIDATADIYGGAIVNFTGTHTYDFRDNTRAATNFANLIRSDTTNGGPTVIYAQAPVILKGASSAAPMQLFEERDTNATKYVYAPGLREYNPSAVTPTILYEAAATTFAAPSTLTDRAYRTTENESLWLTAASGNSFTAGSLGILTSSGVVLADADAESTTAGLMVMALGAVSAGANGEFSVRGPLTTSGLTAGATYYASQTAGAFTATAPSATGTQVRPVGYALSTTALWFDPDKTYVENP